MILLTILMAARRAELKQFWTGMFYDEILFDPYKNYLDLQQDSIKSIDCYAVLNILQP